MEKSKRFVLSQYIYTLGKISVFLPKMSSEVVNFSNLTNFASNVYLSERKTKRQDGNPAFLDRFRTEPILSFKSSIAQFLTR